MPDNQEPGLISGHAQYAKGYVTETIGNVTGSTVWSESGSQQKEAGLTEMKEAGHKRDVEGTHGAGKPETVAGKVFGCEGMEREGEASEGK